MTKKELSAKIKDYFSDKKEVIAVYLYGSYAKNSAKKDSDLDLAVLFDDYFRNRLSLHLQLEDELSSLLQKKVEIQDLNSCRIDFAYRVLQEGILIFIQDDKLRTKFEVSTSQRYFDLKPLFDEYYAELKRQSLKGDFHA